MNNIIKKHLFVKEKTFSSNPKKNQFFSMIDSF